MTEVEFDIKPVMARMQVTAKKLVSSKFMGEYRSAFRGKGLEFDGYRVYDEHDDAASIDWRASAKANELLVRQYVEERSIEIFFLVDSSASMVFGSQAKLKHEYAAEFTASLAYAMLNAGDSVGAAIFNDDICWKMPLNQGSKQAYTLMHGLSEPNNYGGGCNLADAIDFTLSYVNSSGVVLFIVSDFLGLAPGWDNSLKLAARKFDVIGVCVRDERDNVLPQGVGLITLEDPFSGQQLLVNTDSIRDGYASEASRQVSQTKEAFLKAGADFLPLTTNAPFIKPLLGLFNKRANAVK